MYTHAHTRTHALAHTHSHSHTHTPLPPHYAVNPDKELRWRGSLPIPGLFVGEHFFIIHPSPSGDAACCLLEHGEHFSGLLVPMLGGMLKASEEGFHQMNAGLKSRAEGSS